VDGIFAGICWVIGLYIRRQKNSHISFSGQLTGEHDSHFLVPTTPLGRSGRSLGWLRWLRAAALASEQRSRQAQGRLLARDSVDQTAGLLTSRILVNRQTTSVSSSTQRQKNVMENGVVFWYERYLANTGSGYVPFESSADAPASCFVNCAITSGGNV
jgi:hypothetical protein